MLYQPVKRFSKFHCDSPCLRVCSSSAAAESRHEYVRKTPTNTTGKDEPLSAFWKPLVCFAPRPPERCATGVQTRRCGDVGGFWFHVQAPELRLPRMVLVLLLHIVTNRHTRFRRGRHNLGTVGMQGFAGRVMLASQWTHTVVVVVDSTQHSDGLKMHQKSAADRNKSV